jgi:hypothetical protein
MRQWRTVPGTLLPFIAGKLSAAEAEVRYRAAYLLACAGKDAAAYADHVAALADDDSPAGYRGEHAVGDAAVWALARMGDPRAVRELGTRLRTGRLGFTRPALFAGMPDQALPGSRTAAPLPSSPHDAANRADMGAARSCRKRADTFGLCPGGPACTR